MRRIWKYPLVITDIQAVKMPIGATPLTVQVQDNQVCLWAIVDPQAGEEWRTLYIFGTGNPTIGLDVERPANYIGTFQSLDGQRAFHVFIRATA